MYPILYKKQLSEYVYLMRIHAPLIAQERQAGQFVMLQLHPDYGERIPLTIADADTLEGSITIIFQIAGKTTQDLSALADGERIPIVVGPLGNPTHIEKFGSVLCIGGGIGVAPLYPIAQALHNAGNCVQTIIGAKTADLLFYRKEMAAVSEKLIICTDDGSEGRRAFVTEPLKEICLATPPRLVIAIGPVPMMRACTEVTRPFAIETLVSLNSIMVDGTGMCGGCRVTIAGKVAFVCVEGPEFNGHQVDWANMASRLNTFRQQEIRSHVCKIDTLVENKLETGRS